MAKMKRGLGKGIGALLGDEHNEKDGKDIKKGTVAKTGEQAQEEEKGEVFVNIALVEPNKNQPRKNFKKEELEELSASIRQYGILQPLIVKKNGKKYEIIAGERRWRAANQAGLKEVPVVIRDYDKQKTMEISIIENIQRSDLNAIEEALAFKSLIDEFGLTQEELSLRVSKNRATIANSIRLLKLDEEVQGFLIEGKLSAGHARVLLAVEDREIQKKLAKDIIDANLSVREVEKLIKSLAKPARKKPEKEEERDLSIFFKEYEEKIRQILGTQVHINRKDKNKGRIEIEYYSAVELDRILELLRTIKQ